MYFRTFIGICVLISVGYSKVLPLPSYITKCSRSAPDFDECCLRNAIEAIPFIQKGDKKYNIPNLLPLKLPYIGVKSGSDFSLNLNDSTIYGFETITLQKLRFDLKNQNIFGKIFAKRMELNGHYDVNGRILVLPIQGEGTINITAVDCEYEYTCPYVFEERDGQKFVKISNEGTTKIGTKRAYFDLTNLFNGNKELGDATNKAINDDWEQLIETIKPAMSETLIKLINSIINGFASKVPFSEFFLD